MSSTTTEEGNQINIINEQRRKRVNRIKLIIITLGILFLTLPTIFCVFLGVKVVKLQKQVNELAILHDQDSLVKEDVTYANIAYAAEKPMQNADGKSSTEADTEFAKTKLSQEEVDSVEAGNNHEAGNMQDINSKLNSGSDATQNSHGYVTDTQTSEVYDYIENPELLNPGLDSNNTDKANISPSPSNDNPAEYSNGVSTGNIQANTYNTNAGTSSTDTASQSEYKVEIGVDASSGATVDKQTIAGRYEGKKVYITFDDGPSIYTNDILDILNEYGVKATFFVIGKTDTYSKNMYKRIVDEGHTLGMHSYSHKYDIIYNSVEDFDKDFTKLWKLLYDTTGLEPTIFRFPGGSANKVNKNGMEDFIRYLNGKSIIYYDWNALNGDATGNKYTEEQLIANVLNGVDKKKNSIVLMHDAASKEATVKTLSELLEILISGGAELIPLDTNVTPIQMIRADSIN